MFLFDESEERRAWLRDPVIGRSSTLVRDVIFEGGSVFAGLRTIVAVCEDAMEADVQRYQTSS